MATSPPIDPALHQTLRAVFGFESFRPNQEDIVRAILAKRDVFAVMPTGGGKSLCYQLPAVMLPGTAVVISPLISLMKDQVDAANENGIAAEFLNSSLGAQEMSDVIRMLRSDQIKLLYIAPERFVANGTGGSTGEPMRFESPLPEDMQRLIHELEARSRELEGEN